MGLPGIDRIAGREPDERKQATREEERMDAMVVCEGMRWGTIDAPFKDIYTGAVEGSTTGHAGEPNHHHAPGHHDHRMNHVYLVYRLEGIFT